MNEARRPLVAGNWKMNGSRAALAEIDAIAQALNAEGARGEAIICPPCLMVGGCVEHAGGSGLLIGAQDCHAAASGAHTGDVSAEMLADIGARAVIVGHSERRADHGETDAQVKAKAAAALRAGLTPIVCVGETEVERDSGQAEDVVRAQLEASLPDAASPAVVVVAYEPVWAIGTGRTPGSEDIAAMHAMMRAAVVARYGEAGKGVRLLYGGSVKPGNAAEIFAIADVDGGLVGGASLKASDFLGILRAA